MKSPFKFLDSYTKADHEIFFGRVEYCNELNGDGLKDISPLQGLLVCINQRWTMSNAALFRAYSAKNHGLSCPERARYFNTGHRPVYQHRQTPALKGQDISTHDSVLFISTDKLPP
jgi:hypothetical protein